VTQHNARYTGPTSDNLACLPVELTHRRQWVLWRGVDRIDQATGNIKLNKIPINPHTLTNADSTDPTTWGDFARCVGASLRFCPPPEDAPSLGTGYLRAGAMPPDFVAVALLAWLGGVLGREVSIRPQARTDWTVIPNQWGWRSADPAC
jgi:hypothetical protein